MSNKLRFLFTLMLLGGITLGFHVVDNNVRAEENIAARQNDGGTGTGVFEDDRIIGNLDAPVTIVEYSSLTCPHCAAFHNNAFNDIEENYINTGKVRLIYRDLPWNGLAFRASLVARCMPEKRFFPFLKRLFAEQHEWTKREEAGLIKLAGLAGIDAERYQECINDKAQQVKILERREQALEELKVSGTPYVFINGETLNGARPFAEFQEVIDEALEKAGVE